MNQKLSSTTTEHENKAEKGQKLFFGRVFSLSKFACFFVSVCVFILNSIKRSFLIEKFSLHGYRNKYIIIIIIIMSGEIKNFLKH